MLTILGDEPTVPRDPNNPLELPVAPTGGNPLMGARFFADPYDAPAQLAGRYPPLRRIAQQPNGARFGTFSGRDVGIAVNRYLAQADDVGGGTIPMLATYKLVDGHCGYWTPTAANQADYRRRSRA